MREVGRSQLAHFKGIEEFSFCFVLFSVSHWRCLFEHEYMIQRVCERGDSDGVLQKVLFWKEQHQPINSVTTRTKSILLISFILST